MSGEARDSGAVAIPGHPTEIAGRYRVRKRLGEGGMGVVYECEHVLSKKRLAVKVLFPHLCHGAQAIERFRREVSASAEIDHPGIVQVFDAGVDGDGSFYMAMELLEGESLADRIRRSWPSTYESVELLRQLLSPLGRAHERGFVHRDIKPENLFLVKDAATGRSTLKILDFGLAREVQRKGPTLTGVTFGTPEYMSPEQSLSAKKAGLPSDVWAVGVLGYELLSGFYPFDGETPNAIMVAAIKDPFVPLSERAPHVPAVLARVVETCLEKDAAKRPADARVVAAMLERALADVTLADTRPARTHVDVARERAAAEDEENAAAPIAEVVALPAAPGMRPVGQRGVSTQPAAPSVSSSFWSPRRVAFGAIVGAASVLGIGIVLAMQRAAAPEMTSIALAPPPTAPSPPPTPRLEEPPLEPAPGGEVAELVPAAGDETSEPATAIVTAAPAERPSGRRTEVVPETTASALTDEEYAEAQACIARGEPSCAIDILRRSSRPRDLARVIDLYESLGRTDDSLRAMQSFVRRFPRASETSRYRDTLARHGM